MEPKLGKMILLKNQLIKNLENKNLKEAEIILKVINEEYKKIGNKSLVDILDLKQIENIEKCFGKKMNEIIEIQEKQDKEIRSE